MKEVTLKVKDAKYPFFMELIKSLDFVQVAENTGDSKEEIVAKFTKASENLKLFKEGKLKTTPAKDFLHEL